MPLGSCFLWPHFFFKLHVAPQCDAVPTIIIQQAKFIAPETEVATRAQLIAKTRSENKFENSKNSRIELRKYYTVGSYM